MIDEQIRLLRSLGSDEARLLLENGERALYRRIQSKMVQLVREYGVQLPWNCLQFVYCCNGRCRQNKAYYKQAQADGIVSRRRLFRVESLLR
jgi:hypothetical protein